MTTQAQRAYLAGFFDGEGHVGIQCQPSSNGRSHVLWVAITNTHLPTLEHFHGVWGGYLRAMTKEPAKPHHLIVHRLTWNWGQGGDVLSPAIRPYLITKAAHTDVALAFATRKNIKGQAKRTRITPEEWDAREDMRLSLMALNRGRWVRYPEKFPYPTPTMRCERCGKEAIAWTKTKRFCGKKCQLAAYHLAHK